MDDDSDNESWAKYEGQDWEVIFKKIEKSRKKAFEREKKLIREAQARAPSPNCKLLPRSDSIMFGTCPEHDPFWLVICDICNRGIKPPFLKHHVQKQHPVQMAEFRRRMKSGELNKKDMLRKLQQKQFEIAEKHRQEEALRKKDEEDSDIEEITDQPETSSEKEKLDVDTEKLEALVEKTKISEENETESAELLDNEEHCVNLSAVLQAVEEMELNIDEESNKKNAKKLNAIKSIADKSDVDAVISNTDKYQVDAVISNTDKYQVDAVISNTDKYQVEAVISNAEKYDVDKSGGDKSDGDKSDGDKSDGDKSDGDKSDSENAESDKNHSEKEKETESSHNEGNFKEKFIELETDVIINIQGIKESAEKEIKEIKLKEAKQTEIEKMKLLEQAKMKADIEKKKKKSKIEKDLKEKKDKSKDKESRKKTDKVKEDEGKKSGENKSKHKTNEKESDKRKEMEKSKLKESSSRSKKRGKDSDRNKQKESDKRKDKDQSEKNKQKDSDKRKDKKQSKSDKLKQKDSDRRKKEQEKTKQKEVDRKKDKDTKLSETQRVEKTIQQQKPVEKLKELNTHASKDQAKIKDTGIQHKDRNLKLSKETVLQVKESSKNKRVKSLPIQQEIVDKKSIDKSKKLKTTDIVKQKDRTTIPSRELLKHMRERYEIENEKLKQKEISEEKIKKAKDSHLYEIEQKIKLLKPIKSKECKIMKEKDRAATVDELDKVKTPAMKRSDLLYVLREQFNEEEMKHKKSTEGKEKCVKTSEQPPIQSVTAEIKTSGRSRLARSMLSRKLSTRNVPTSMVPPSMVPPSMVPTSMVPTSMVPTSMVPTSMVPTTKVPTSQVPTTKVPTSKVPTTKVPTSKVPISMVPTSTIPTSMVPPSTIPTITIPTSKVSTSKVSTSQVQTNKVLTSELPTSKVSTSKVQTNKVLTSEVPTTNVLTSKVLTSKVQTSKVQASKVQTSKVQTSKVQTSKVQTSIGQTNKLQTSKEQKQSVQIKKGLPKFKPTKAMKKKVIVAPKKIVKIDKENPQDKFCRIICERLCKDVNANANQVLEIKECEEKTMKKLITEIIQQQNNEEKLKKIQNLESDSLQSLVFETLELHVQENSQTMAKILDFQVKENPIATTFEKPIATTFEKPIATTFEKPIVTTYTFDAFEKSIATSFDSFEKPIATSFDSFEKPIATKEKKYYRNESINVEELLGKANLESDYAEELECYERNRVPLLDFSSKYKLRIRGDRSDSIAPQMIYKRRALERINRMKPLRPNEVKLNDMDKIRSDNSTLISELRKIKLDGRLLQDYPPCVPLKSQTSLSAMKLLRRSRKKNIKKMKKKLKKKPISASAPYKIPNRFKRSVSRFSDDYTLRYLNEKPSDPLLVVMSLEVLRMLHESQLQPLSEESENSEKLIQFNFLKNISTRLQERNYTQSELDDEINILLLNTLEKLKNNNSMDFESLLTKHKETNVIKFVPVNDQSPLRNPLQLKRIRYMVEAMNKIQEKIKEYTNLEEFQTALEKIRRKYNKRTINVIPKFNEESIPAFVENQTTNTENDNNSIIDLQNELNALQNDVSNTLEAFPDIQNSTDLQNQINKECNNENIQNGIAIVNTETFESITGITNSMNPLENESDNIVYNSESLQNDINDINMLYMDDSLPKNDNSFEAALSEQINNAIYENVDVSLTTDMIDLNMQESFDSNKIQDIIDPITLLQTDTNNITTDDLQIGLEQINIQNPPDITDCITNNSITDCITNNSITDCITNNSDFVENELSRHDVDSIILPLESDIFESIPLFDDDFNNSDDFSSDMLMQTNVTTSGASYDSMPMMENQPIYSTDNLQSNVDPTPPAPLMSNFSLDTVAENLFNPDQFFILTNEPTYETINEYEYQRMQNNFEIDPHSITTNSGMKNFYDTNYCSSNIYVTNYDNNNTAVNIESTSENYDPIEPPFSPSSILDCVNYNITSNSTDVSAAISTTDASDITPTTIISDITPTTIISDITPTTIMSDVTPTTIMSDVTPTTIISDVTPTTIISDVTPTTIDTDSSNLEIESEEDETIKLNSYISNERILSTAFSTEKPKTNLNIISSYFERAKLNNDSDLSKISLILEQFNIPSNVKIKGGSTKDIVLKYLTESSEIPESIRNQLINFISKDNSVFPVKNESMKRIAPPHQRKEVQAGEKTVPTHLQSINVTMKGKTFPLTIDKVEKYFPTLLPPPPKEPQIQDEYEPSKPVTKREQLISDIKKLLAPREPLIEITAPKKPVTEITAPKKPVIEITAPKKPVIEITAPKKPVLQTTAPKKPLTTFVKLSQLQRLKRPFPSTGKESLLVKNQSSTINQQTIAKGSDIKNSQFDQIFTNKSPVLENILERRKKKAEKQPPCKRTRFNSEIATITVPDDDDDDDVIIISDKNRPNQSHAPEMNKEPSLFYENLRKNASDPTLIALLGSVPKNVKEMLKLHDSKFKPSPATKVTTPTVTKVIPSPATKVTTPTVTKVIPSPLPKKKPSSVPKVIPSSVQKVKPTPVLKGESSSVSKDKSSPVPKFKSSFLLNVNPSSVQEVKSSPLLRGTPSFLSKVTSFSVPKVKPPSVIEVKSSSLLRATRSFVPKVTLPSVTKVKSTSVLKIAPYPLPKGIPSSVPKQNPSSVPKVISSSVPKAIPSFVRKIASSSVPKVKSSSVLKKKPSSVPKVIPSSVPKVIPSSVPKAVPSFVQKFASSSVPKVKSSSVLKKKSSSVLKKKSSSVVKKKPSSVPKVIPSSVPKKKPSSVPKVIPSSVPNKKPSAVPKKKLSAVPQVIPSSALKATSSFVPKVTSSCMSKPTPSFVPKVTSSCMSKPTPSFVPKVTSSSVPNKKPSFVPKKKPSLVPNVIPSLAPKAAPSFVPKVAPSSVPKVKSSSVLKKKSSSVLKKKSSSVVKKKLSSVVKKKSSSVLKKKLSSVLKKKSSSVRKVILSSATKKKSSSIPKVVKLPIISTSAQRKPKVNKRPVIRSNKNKAVIKKVIRAKAKAKPLNQIRKGRKIVKKYKKMKALKIDILKALREMKQPRPISKLNRFLKRNANQILDPHKENGNTLPIEIPTMSLQQPYIYEPIDEEEYLEEEDEEEDDDETTPYKKLEPEAELTAAEMKAIKSQYMVNTVGLRKYGGVVRFDRKLKILRSAIKTAMTIPGEIHLDYFGNPILPAGQSPCTTTKSTSSSSNFSNVSQRPTRSTRNLRAATYSARQAKLVEKLNQAKLDEENEATIKEMLRLKALHESIQAAKLAEYKKIQQLSFTQQKEEAPELRKRTKRNYLSSLRQKLIVQAHIRTIENMQLEKEMNRRIKYKPRYINNKPISKLDEECKVIMEQLVQAQKPTPCPQPQGLRPGYTNNPLRLKNRIPANWLKDSVRAFGQNNNTEIYNQIDVLASSPPDLLPNFHEYVELQNQKTGRNLPDLQ